MKIGETVVTTLVIIQIFHGSEAVRSNGDFRQKQSTSQALAGRFYHCNKFYRSVLYVERKLLHPVELPAEKNSLRWSKYIRVSSAADIVVILF